MAWLQALIGDDSAIQLVLITIGLVIALIVLFWVFRKIVGTPASRAARNRIPRLSVTDAAVVDEKRRLILVRRDDVEHLLLIGGPSDVVVETNVMRAQQRDTRSIAPAAKSDSAVAESNKFSTPESVVTTATVAGSDVTFGSRKPDTTEKETQPEIKSVENSAPVASEPTLTAATRNDGESDESPENPNVDLESKISEKLDDTLATIEVKSDNDDKTSQSSDDGGEISVVSKSDSSKSEDEMQKLLDELASEVKEPA